jgi:pimeloyl-ACP methyl ester carboxylesterase
MLRFRYIYLDSGRYLHVAEQGSAKDSPAILLLHAFVDSWFSFQPLLAQLPPQSCYAIAPDQRGHGRSEVPVGGFEVEDFARDAVALLDALGIESAVIVTASSASFTGRLLAECFPERVAGLLLLGGPGVSLDAEATAAFVEEMTAWGDRDPVPAGFAADLFGAMTALPMAAEFAEQMVADNCRVPVRVWRSTFDGLLDFEDRADLGRIDVPTVLVRGELDEFISGAAVAELTSLIPGSRLLTYPAAGHVPHWDLPDLVAADLLCLVESTVTATTTGDESAPLEAPS